MDALAFGVVFKDPRIAVAVGNEDSPIRSKADVARATRSGGSAGRLLADRNLHQLLALRRELVDHRTSRIGGPNVALRVDTDAVGDLVHSLPPRPHNLAVFIHD